MMKHWNLILFIVFTFFLSSEYYPENNSLRIAIVYPELTKEVVYKNDNSFKPTDDWEIFFMSKHIKYKMFQDNSIEEIDDDIDVVIFPSLEAVTENLVEGIEELLNRGKGLLFTGNFGIYDEDRNKISKDFQHRIRDFEITRLPDINEISINHTLIGNTPFAIDLLPGTRMLLRQKPVLYFASDLSNMCNKEGYFFPVDKNSPDTISGFISEYKFSGRLLWLGCNFDQLMGDNRDKFLMNSFNWLSSKPVAFINDLPGDYSSAAIIYRNIEKQSVIISNSSDSNKINYFVSPLVFEDSGNKINDLCNGGTINVLWDDYFFSNMTPEKRKRWLSQTNYLIKGVTAQNYTGIFSSGELSDTSDYKLFDAAGYSFRFSSGYSNSFFAAYDSSKKIYTFINPSISAQDLRSGLNYILNNNGILYIPADSLKTNDSYFNDLREQHLWFATFPDLLNWITKKEQLQISGQFVNDEYNIRLVNNNSDGIHNLDVWISIPDITKSPYIKNVYNNSKLTFEPGKKMYKLKIDFVPGKGNVSFTIAGITR